jgi:hypothetical protein
MPFTSRFYITVLRDCENNWAPTMQCQRRGKPDAIWFQSFARFSDLDEAVAAAKEWAACENYRFLESEAMAEERFFESAELYFASSA